MTEAKTPDYLSVAVVELLLRNGNRPSRTNDDHYLHVKVTSLIASEMKA
jgi:hypothetical protein